MPTPIYPMEEPPETVPISEAEHLFSSDDPARLKHWQLALQSAHIPFRMEWDGETPALIVPGEYLDRAREELASYDYNNIDWPPLPIKEPPAQQKAKPLATIASLETGLACLIILTAIHIRSTLSGELWKNAGLWNADKIRSGEIWRLLTALTLHADEAHLASNFFWITALIALLGVDLGGGLAVFFMLLTGLVSNLAMLFIGAEHSSLGASTLVFALVGLLCALRTADCLKTRVLRGGSLVSLLPWFPLFIAIALFAFYGTAPGSDVLAHFCGLLCGLLLGVVAIPCKRFAVKSWLQLTAALLTSLSLLLAILKLPTR